METQKQEPARRNGDIDSVEQTGGASSAAALREEVVEILSGAIARLVITGGYRRATDRAQDVAHDSARGGAP